MFEFTWNYRGKKMTEIVSEEDKEKKWNELNELLRSESITFPFCIRIIQKGNNDRKR